MKKILSVIGARPQFIKAAVVSRSIRQRNNISEVLVHTGQHFDKNMSDIFFNEMEIPQPDYRLHVNSLSHGKMTGRMLEQLEEVINKECPSAVLVYGDTNSTLAGALAAAKMHIPVAHVEAGLRSFNMKMPEEINRILTDRVSKWLFAPTLQAIKNLEKEGFDSFDSEVYLSGDVMLDALMFYKGKLNNKQTEIEIPNTKFVLATLHREENTLDKKRLSKAVEILNSINKDIQVIMPLHPGTAKRIQHCDKQPMFKLIGPVGYFDMIRLLDSCEFVITDSGGLQKEAFLFGKYCLTLRDQTEWVELVENNVNYVCGVDSDKVKFALNEIKKTFPENINLYGTGNAGEEIVKILEEAIL